MESVFDPPTLPIAAQPLLGVAALRRATRRQGDRLILAPNVLPHEPGRLGGKRETDVFRGDRTGLNGP